MRSDDLMTRMRAANPVPPTAFHDWTETPESKKLVEDIIATPRETISARFPSRQRASSRLRALATHRPLVEVAAALLILGIVVVSIPRSGPGRGSAWAAPLVEIAEGSPRLLIAQEGWEVVSAAEFSGEIGDMTFSNGEFTLDLIWGPADWHNEHIADLEDGARNMGGVTIAGQRAILFQHRESTDFTAAWRDGEHSLVLNGNFPAVDDYRSVAAAIERADVNTWLSALPESVVQPYALAANVEEMLADIPVHPSVDVAALKTSGRVNDRYQLGAEVTRAVSCAWIGQWVSATATGDETKVQEAVDAMATSHNWSILLEMNEQGDWPEIVWEYADAMAANAPVSGGRPMPIAEAYQSSLGC